MKRRSFLTLGAILMLPTLPIAVHAKAAYKGETQMIESAHIIAIVEIVQTEEVSVKGTHWTYRQKATAKIERVLKGKLGATADFYGDENFICARCHFETGRYLVFLDRDGELLIGNNWHLSVCKISGDDRQKTIEWPNIDPAQPPTKQRFEDALNEIRRALKTTKS